MIIKLLKYKLHSLARNIYWLINLSKANKGENIQIHFPVIVEGKGQLAIGAGSILKKKCELLIQKGSKLNLEKQVTVFKNVILTISDHSSLILEDHVRISEHVKFFVNKNSRVAQNTFIGSYASIFSREGLSGKINIGKNCGIGDYTIIDVSDDVTIEDSVAIGPNCTLYTHDHDYKDKSLPAWKGGVNTGKITIEEGAWVGSGATILPNVTIGKGAVIAAGSVVTKSVPEYQIWGGIPARLIKER